MSERMTFDISADLRRVAAAFDAMEVTEVDEGALLREAADKLDGLITDLAKAENARDAARASVARLEQAQTTARAEERAAVVAWLRREAHDQLATWSRELLHDTAAKLDRPATPAPAGDGATPAAKRCDTSWSMIGDGYRRCILAKGHDGEHVDDSGGWMATACICDTEKVDAGGYLVTKLNADAGCPQHGEHAPAGDGAAETGEPAPACGGEHGCTAERKPVRVERHTRACSLADQARRLAKYLETEPFDDGAIEALDEIRAEQADTTPPPSGGTSEVAS